MALRRPIIQNFYRGHRITSEPAAEPVSLADLKDFLRIDSTSEDSQISLLITVARQYIEQATGLALITQTWTLTMDQWPNDGSQWWDGVRQGPISMINGGKASEVYLPRYPLQSVTSITVEGSPVVVADLFTVDTQRFPGRIVLKQSATLPTYTETANAISIAYIAGFGDDSDDVPSTLKLAVLQLASNLYTHRGDECSVQRAYIDSGAQSLVGAYQSGRI
jgi:hypothetical protein